MLIPKSKPLSLIPKAKSPGAGSRTCLGVHLSQMIPHAMGRAAAPTSLALVPAGGLPPHLSDFAKKTKQTQNHDFFIPLVRQSGKFIVGQLLSDSAVRGADKKGDLTESWSEMTFFPLSISFRAGEAMGIPRAVAQKIDMVQTGEILLPELVPHGKRRGSPAGGWQVPHGGQEVAMAGDLGCSLPCCLHPLPVLPPQADVRVHGVPCSCK